MTPIRTILAASIARARRRKGLKQSELAKLVGVTEDTISDWERPKGEGLPRFEGLVALATALDTPIDALLMGDEAYGERLKRDLLSVFEPRFAELQRQIDDLKTGRR